MPERRVVATGAAPAAIGPYSQAVVAGDLVFTAGQIALDPVSGALVGEGDVAREAQRALENLRGVLEAAGSGMDLVLRCDLYLQDLADFGRVNEVYARFFPAAPPARVTIQAAALPREARVEVAAVACRRAPPGASRGQPA